MLESEKNAGYCSPAFAAVSPAHVPCPLALPVPPAHAPTRSVAVLQVSDGAPRSNAQ